jgi:hypothetical protein
MRVNSAQSVDDLRRIVDEYFMATSVSAAVS